MKDLRIISRAGAVMTQGAMNALMDQMDWKDETIATLKRQVEALAEEFSKHGRCGECQARSLCQDSNLMGGITCRDAIKQWSLEQAKAVRGER